jgi:hypothetical protein
MSCRMAERKPCVQCGGPKPPGRAQKFCGEACRDLAHTIYLSNQRAGVRKDGTPVRRNLEVHRERRAIQAARAPDELAARRARQRDAYLRARFGLSSDDYDVLLAAQDGRCAICLARPRKRRLHVDHDHRTGTIRGLLCIRCNHYLLGAAHDSPDVLRRAVEYLERDRAA